MVCWRYFKVPILILIYVFLTSKLSIEEYILVFLATVLATFQNKLGTFVSKLLVTLAGAPPRWSFGAKPGSGANVIKLLTAATNFHDKLERLFHVKFNVCG